MKKIIPFKKDIIFKTNLSEITSISLEHTLKMDEHVMSGNFIVSGEYKITDNSRDTETFSYDLPFSINFDNKYKLDKAIIDIDDFYYEIVNDNVLSINIEAGVDKIEEILIEEPFDFNDNVIETRENTLNTIKEEEISIKEEAKEEEKRCIEEDTTSLFNNISIEETYKTYKIYIVRENDTIDAILNKYNVTKDTLELYNDLTEFKLGDKIIIPAIYEGN